MQGSSVAEGPGARPLKYCDKMDVAEGWLPFRLDTESRLGCELVFTFSQRLPSVDFEPGRSCTATWGPRSIPSIQ